MSYAHHSGLEKLVLPLRDSTPVAPALRPLVSIYENYARATARVAEPSGSLGEAKEWGLDREDLPGR